MRGSLCATFAVALALALLAVTSARAEERKNVKLDGWPKPYDRVPLRPMASPFCEAKYPFCPTGAASIPVMQPTDRLEIYMLQAPVWEFKFGNLLGKAHIFHDAIGVRNLDSGLDYTMEWYELFQLGNCTFPHIVPGEPNPVWCNQGASCVYEGIDENHWKSNGTMAKVTEISGSQFNQLADWIRWDNGTAIYYETWTVMSEWGGQKWFDSHDCANWVINVYKELFKLGARFDTSIVPKITFVVLHSDLPELVINGTRSSDPIMKDIMQFYSYFQPHQSFFEIMKHLAEVIIKDVFWDGKFYLFYNEKYYKLNMKPPYFSIRYEDVPFPQ